MAMQKTTLPTKLDVLLVLGRDLPGVTVPTEDEVDTRLHGTSEAAKWTRAAGYCVQLASYHLGLQPDAGEPVILTKRLDRASTLLLTLFSKQLVLPWAKLAVRLDPSTASQGWAPHLIYTLGNARISALTWATSNVDNVSEEHLTLTYESLTIEYHPRDAQHKLLAPISAVYPPAA